MSGNERPLRDLLRKNLTYLIDELIVSYYVPHLCQEEVLCDEDMDRLTVLPSRRQKAERFVDLLIHKSESGIQKFFDFLRTQTTMQPHIYSKLFPQHTSTEQHDTVQQRGDSIHTATSGSHESTSSSALMTDPEWDELVVPRFPAVVAALRPLLLLDHLRACRLLNATEFAELQRESLSELDRSRRLVNTMLPGKGKGSFAKFCRVLHDVESQRHIVTEILKLQGEGSPPTVNAVVFASESLQDASVQERRGLLPAGLTARRLQQQPPSSREGESRGGGSSTVTPVSQNPEYQAQERSERNGITFDIYFS